MADSVSLWQKSINGWPGFGLAVALGVLVQIQTTLPIGSIGLRINAADPVVGVTAAMAVIAVLLGQWRPAWRVPHLPVWFAALTVVLLMSLAVAWYTVGYPGSWAIFNRGIGWLVLLGFFLAGASIGFAREEVRAVFITTLCAAMAVTVVVEMVLYAVHLHHTTLPIFEARTQFKGFLANANAYGFFLLVCLTLLLPRTVVSSDGSSIRKWMHRLLLLALLLGVVWSASRAAYLGLLVLTLVLFALPSTRWVELVVGLPIAVMLYAATLFGPDIASLTRIGTAAFSDTKITKEVPALRRLARTTPDASTNERIALSQDALALWAGNPVLGAGLGAFVRDQVEQGKPPVRVHNTALWLLAETGAVGLFVFLATFARVFVSLWRSVRKVPVTQQPIVKAGVLLMAVFALESLFHDMLYQRILWLSLGVVLVMPLAPQHTPEGATTAGTKT